MLLLITAILLSTPVGSVAAGTNGIELKQLVQQYLPGARLQPDAPAKPRALISASGGALDLPTALRENPQPRKKAGYWVTPTMTFLSRQHMAAATTNDAQGVIQLLHALTRGPSSVKQIIYRASAVDGGWVVEVEPASAKNPEKIPAMTPYELLVDAGRRVAQIRQRCYAYAGSPAVYELTVRTVYEREIKLNGGINFQAMVEKELAKEWEKEKEQKMLQP
jgi:hypothetical protein